MQRLKGREELRTGVNCQAGAEREKNTVRERLITTDSSSGDQCDSNDCANEICAEEPEDCVAPTQPSETQTEYECQANVAKSENARTDQVEDEEKQVPRYGTNNAHCEMMPVMFDTCGEDEQCRHQSARGVDNLQWKHQSLGVDAGQCEKTGQHHEKRGEIPVPAQARRRSAKETGRREFH